MGFDHDTLDYELSSRAFVYRRAQAADPRLVPPRQRYGLQSAPFLGIVTHRAWIRVEEEHHYTSGHAWIIDDDRPVLLQAEGVTPALRALVGEATGAALARLCADAGRWGPAVWRSLLVPMRGAAPDRVPPEEADVWELGRSITGDGRLPSLTLRLHPTHAEVVRDHGFSGPVRERHLEVLHPTADDATITALFGEEVLAVVQEVRAR